MKGSENDPAKYKIEGGLDYLKDVYKSSKDKSHNKMDVKKFSKK